MYCPKCGKEIDEKIDIFRNLPYNTSQRREVQK